MIGLFAALQASPIDLICTGGEEGAGFAADAHGRLQGLGVAVVTYGVGALKLLNPVAGAYAERSPLPVISGAPGLRESEEHPLLHHRIRADQTQLRLFREVTVASAVLDSGRTAAKELVRVLEAMRRESRPAYLELPADCLSREVSVQGLDMVCLAPRGTTGSACGGSASLRWGFLGPRRWVSSHRKMAFGGADPLRRDESHVHPAP